MATRSRGTWFTCRGSGSGVQAPEERVDAALLQDAEGREEGVAQVHVALRDGVKGSIEPVQDGIDERVSEAQGGRGKLVGDSGFEVRIVSGIAPEHAHPDWSQDLREPEGAGHVI